MKDTDTSSFTRLAESDRAVLEPADSGPSGSIEALQIEIAERKRAEAALRQQKEVLETILDNVPAMIALRTPDGAYKWLNRQWQKVLGWSLAETRNHDILAELYPDPEYRQAAAEFIQKADGTWREWRTRLRDGTILDTLWANVSLSDGSTIGIGKDTTERRRAEEALRQSEERYRAVVQDQTEVITRFRPDGTFLFVNDAYARLFGNRPEEMIGRTWLPDAHPDDVAMIQARLAQMTPENPVVALENRVISGSRETRWMQFVNRGSFDSHGKLLEIQSVGRDVTERRLAEKALSESEERNRQFFELGAVAMGEVDPATRRLVRVNDRYCEMTGYSREEMLGFTVYDLTHPDDRETDRLRFSRMLTGETLEHFSEKRYIRKDGRVIWVQVTARLIRDAAGTPIRSAGVVLDITDRKRAAAELAASEAKYRRLHESITDAFAVSDTAGRIQEANRAYRDMLGYSQEELSQLTYRDLTPEKWHDFEARIIEEQVLQRGFSDVYEKEYRRKDGTVFPVELRAFLLTGETGEPLGVWAIVRDITERKRAEEVLQTEAAFRKAVIDTAAEGLCACHETTAFPFVEFTVWNDRMTEITGYTLDEINRLGLYQTLYRDPAVRERALHRISRMRLADELIAEEWTISRKDGRSRIIAISTKGLRAHGGQDHVVAMIQDLTDRKQAEEQLARYQDHLEDLVAERTRELDRSREKLQRAERLASIGTLAAGIAHEINNPLGMLLLGADVALTSLDQPEALKELLSQIRRDVERCSRIVRGVLDFARQQVTEKWPLELNEVVRRSLDFTREYARKNHVNIEISCAQELPCILGNSTELEQVVVNLLHNAVQACHDEGHIWVETHRARGYVRLVVRDDGRGMTQEQIGHAFDPFYTTRLDQGGTGLGLSTVHGIVTGHGGAIDLASQPGRGTVFTVEFPVTTEMENADGQNPRGG